MVLSLVMQEQKGQPDSEPLILSNIDLLNYVLCAQASG